MGQHHCWLRPRDLKAAMVISSGHLTGPRDIKSKEQSTDNLRGDGQPGLLEHEILLPERG